MTESYHIQESAPNGDPVNDLRLITTDESMEDGWLELGREPFQLLVGGRHRLFRVMYRHGPTSPLTSLAVFSTKTKVDRRLWSRAYQLDFRSAAKSDQPVEPQALWLRRGPRHPPLRRLALITGQWSDLTAEDRVELRSQWRLVDFCFSDTLADYVFLGFSIR